MKQQKSQLKIGVILNYVNMILGNLIPIFYTPIMLSLLGQEEYGLYKLSSSVTSYLSLISFGIGSAVTRYLIKAEREEGKESEERTFGLFMVIFQVIAVLALVIGTILTLNLDVIYGQALSAGELARMKLLVFLMVCNMALSFSQSPYVSVITSHERFVFLQCINIVTTCVGPLLNLLMLLLGFASVGMTISTLIVALFCRLANTLYVRRVLELKPRYRNMPIKALREILVFSFWIFVSNVVNQLYNATDTVLIGALPALGTVAVAVYSVGNTFNSLVCNITTSLSSVFAPTVNRSVFSGASRNEITNLCIRIGRIQAYIIALGASGFISFGREFIHIYAGSEYRDAFWIAIFMLIPNCIPVIQSLCLSVLIAQNKHRFRAILYLIIATLNVAGTWCILPYAGIIGAALVTGVSQIIGQLVLNWYYYKKGGVDVIRFWKEIFPTILAAVPLMVITLCLSNWLDFTNILVFMCGVAAYTSVFAVISWRFLMNPYEKKLIAGMFSPIIKLIKMLRAVF